MADYTLPVNNIKLGTLIERASKLVTPSGEEIKKLERVSALIRSLLEREFESERKNAGFIVPNISLGGSYAKGTWLRDSADIDFFLLYPVSYPREKLENEAIRVSKQAVAKFQTNMRFAEHPYVEAFVDGVRVNLVPCYKVKQGEWQSAADRSPFHAEYVISRFDDGLRRETRLLKKFIKCSGVYGAEVKIQGFSGYVCEVLALKFGSFLDVLKNISESKPGQVVSIDDSYDRELAASFHSALVILDPVDQARNLGSAISSENVAKLVLRARMFLEKPSLSYFRVTEAARAELNQLSKENLDWLLSRIEIVSFHMEKRSVDILWGQLRKSSGALASKLEQLGYEVIRFSSASNEEDECSFLFLLREKKISSLQLRKGPEYFRGDEMSRYMEKNRKKSVLSWFDTDGRVISANRRIEEETESGKILREVLSDRSQIEKLGLSKAIQKEMKEGFRVESAAKLLQSGKENSKRRWLVDALISLITSESELA